MKLTREQVEGVRLLLNNAGATSPCARCQGSAWYVYDEFVQLPVNLVQDVERSGVIACAATVCRKCGHVSLHSMRELLEKVSAETTPGSS